MVLRRLIPTQKSRNQNSPSRPALVRPLHNYGGGLRLGMIIGFFAASILLNSPLSLAFDTDSGPTGALAQGRAALEKNQQTEAKEAYQKIPWGHPAWTQKIHDYIRFYLSPKDEAKHLRPEAAWKLTQLARRVRKTEIPRLGYYEALSAYLAGSCPLEYADANDVFSELLWASTYRYAEKFNQAVLKGGESFGDMEDGIRTDSFVAGFVPYLSDLKNTTLVKGAGCRAYRRFLNPTRAPSYELDHLMAAIRQPSSGGFTLRNEDLWLLEIRAQALAKKVGNSSAEIYLKVATSRFANEDLIHLPAAERRMAFADRFDLTDSSRFKKGQLEASLVVAILKDAALDDVDWMSLLDLDSFNPKERYEILLPWRERDLNHTHPYLMLKLAEAEYQLGKIEPALQDLHESACCTSNEGDTATGEQTQIDEFVADLAERIFKEFHFDAKVLGALRGTLSPHLWHSIEERLLYDYIAAGDVKSFDRIMVGFKSNDEQLKPAMKTLVRRQLSAFSKAWALITKQNRYLSPSELRFARDLAHAVFTIDGKQRTALIPFTRLVSETLQIKMSASNPELVEEQQLLIHQLAATGDWQEGNSLVRSGVISVGRVELGSKSKINNPFHFSVPVSLPKARLVLMPIGFSNSEWVLQ